MPIRRAAAPVLSVLAAIGVVTACTGSSGAAPTRADSTPAPVASPLDSGHHFADWPMYHGTANHSGFARTMPKAHGPLKVVRKMSLDGAVYASPIIVGGTTIVATENDTVYAFGPKLHHLWRNHLGHPSPSQQRQCGDIDPLGITGTPIYDKKTGLVYLVTEKGGNVRHVLYALHFKTGRIAWKKSVDLPGVSARDMQQRGALAISNGRVWVPYGAQAGDCGNYKGRVVGVRLDGKGKPIFYSPPTERGGGMWNPMGATRLKNGNLLMVSANGAAFPGDKYDHTNSVDEINGKAKLVDSFAPHDWAANNQGDVGLGSQGVALVGKKWAVLGGKSGPVYVLNRQHLGGIAGAVSVKNICLSYGGSSVVASTVYLPCTDGTRAVRVNGKGKMHVRWHAESNINGTPVVGGGRVWVLDYTNGVLHALDPKTGKSLRQADVGATNRFASPAIYGHDVYVPTLTGLTVVRTS